MIRRSLVLACCLAAAPAAAQTLPKGYVPATVSFGVTGLMSHEEPGGARRRDCGKSVTGVVLRDGLWRQAFGHLACGK